MFNHNYVSHSSLKMLIVVPQSLDKETREVQRDIENRREKKREREEDGRKRKKARVIIRYRSNPPRSPLRSCLPPRPFLRFVRPFECVLPFAKSFDDFRRVISRNAIYTGEISSIIPRLLIYWRRSKANALPDIHIQWRAVEDEETGNCAKENFSIDRRRFYEQRFEQRKWYREACIINTLYAIQLVGKCLREVK